MAAKGFGVAAVNIFDNAAELLANSDEAIQFSGEIANEAAAIARDTMPVVTGHERDSIVAGVGSLEGQETAYFGSTSSTWHLVEFGTAKIPPNPVLRNAAESAGMKLDEEPK